MRALLGWILLSGLALPLSAEEKLADGEIRVARYTTLSHAPADSHADPLEAIVQISLPRQQVHSVGDAVNYLLLRTGYRLVSSEQVDARVREVLALTLPEIHRRLGPYTVHTALNILLGKPFVVTVDPLRRTIAYWVEDVNHKIPRAAQAPNTNLAVAAKPVMPAALSVKQLPLIQPLATSQLPRKTSD